MTTVERAKKSIPDRHPSIFAWFTECYTGPEVRVTKNDHDYFGEYYSLRLDAMTCHVTREQLLVLRGQIDTAIRAALEEE